MNSANSLSDSFLLDHSPDQDVETHHVRAANLGSMVLREDMRDPQPIQPEKPSDLTVQTIAKDIHTYIHYYGIERAKTDEEVVEAQKILLDVGSDIPEQLGYNREHYTKSPNQDGFLKENDPSQAEASRNFFKVVYDASGAEWLLKYAGLTSVRADGKDVIMDTRALEVSEEEVGASRIAMALGYPVPETKLVAPVIEDDEIDRAYRGYIAYRFIAHASDYSFYDKQQDSTSGYPELMVIRNPEDIAFRPIFNALVGSVGDGATQAIVSQETGIYYAQDLGMSAEMPYKRGLLQYESWDEALRTMFSPDIASHIDYGLPPEVTEQNRAKFDTYFEAMRQLTPEKVSTLLSPETPLMQSNLTHLSQVIAERARVLVGMYDSGFFDSK